MVLHGCFHAFEGVVHCKCMNDTSKCSNLCALCSVGAKSDKGMVV